MPGWNLGNQLEASSGGTPGETVWGNPVITEKLIKQVKAQGFKSIRIPVSYLSKIGAGPNYTIDSKWLDRVQEVVDMCIDNGLYAIINVHGDGYYTVKGGWLLCGEPASEQKKIKAKYEKVWEQIAKRFKNYDEHLVFESMNEEFDNTYGDPKPEYYNNINAYNQIFVDTVRKAGGKNNSRYLLIPGWNTDINYTTGDCDTYTMEAKFVIPNDSRIMISVHYYSPWEFCGEEGNDTFYKWGDSAKKFVKPRRSETLVNRQFDKLYNAFIKNGYGVVIGEYAVMQKNGGLKPDTDKFYANVLDNCDLYDFCPVLWDCSNFYKRVTNTLADETIAELFSSRRYENENKDTDTVKAEAKARIDETAQAASDEQMASIEYPPSDDMAIAWIMYASSDYGVSYSVGDSYDPTSCTTGVKAQNAQITGEGTYTVSLDFSDCGMAKGVSFSALGISNGEQLFPGYTYTVDEILINGEAYEMTGKGYTCSDDGKCTRVNLYNGWVNTVPDDARTADGDMTDCSPQIMQLTDGKRVKTISVTFTVKAGQ